MITLQEIQATHVRITSAVRRTPLIEAQPVKRPATDAALYLKLECLQITGSFKARGAINKLMSLTPDKVARGIVTASGGNHGLGIAYAGWIAKVPATIYLAHNTPPIKAEKIASWGAKVVEVGDVWDDANEAALQAAEQQGLTYFHPFADEVVIAGQGTIALEILADVPDMDVLLVAIGGGGLISGVSLAAKAINPAIQVIGVEPTGAASLYESVKAGHLIELDHIETAANTLAPRLSAPINFEIIRDHVDQIVLVSDAEMHDAARWLWEEMGVAAELSGAAAMAALLSNKVQIAPTQKVCVLVCGAGTEGM